MFKILEFLPYGAENAMPGELLASLMNVKPRQLRAQILRLRRAGYPILSVADEGFAGYFLPEDSDKGRAEAKRFIRSQRRRAATAFMSIIGPSEFVTRNDRQISLPDCDSVGVR